MSRASLLLAASASLAAAATPAAQLASSASIALVALEVAGGGGGASSPARAAFGALAGTAGAESSSPSFSASLGFLTAHDPEPTNAPVIFGLSPGLGPVEGGTAVTISGLNFDAFGAGAGVQVSFAGAAAPGASVLSDTTIACTVPPGPAGPLLDAHSTVAVSSAFGTGESGDWIYTPAVDLSDSVVVGGTLVVSNFGPVGALFETWWSTATTALPLPPFGTLLVGPEPLAKLIEASPYPGPLGVDARAFSVPSQPGLHGLSLHVQSVAILSLDPPDVRLTNRSSTVVQ